MSTMQIVIAVAVFKFVLFWCSLFADLCIDTDYGFSRYGTFGFAMFALFIPISRVLFLACYTKAKYDDNGIPKTRKKDRRT